jgi:hypothetical protein
MSCFRESLPKGNGGSGATRWRKNRRAKGCPMIVPKSVADVEKLIQDQVQENIHLDSFASQLAV